MIGAASDVETDRFASARLVADAVLYEGYVLYPYRASAQKNQMRWQFGVLTPPDHARASGSERCTMRSEVVVDPGDHPVLSVRIRCLQVQHRDIEVAADDGASFTSTGALDVDGRTVMPWDEAIEHEIDIDPVPLLPISGATTEHRIVLPASASIEPLCAADGRIVGRAIRSCEGVDGVVRVATMWADGVGTLLKVVISVDNTTPWNVRCADRDSAMRRSLVAVHTLLALDDGSFVSLLEPPAFAEQAVAGCTSDGTFPVLIGSVGTSDVMLSSPIILYDQPVVAPESAGDFCDSTEIDEILALRVMTLTDDEKAEARGTDPRSAAIVDLCDGMPQEIWARLHGAIRSLRPIQSAQPDDVGVDAGAPSVPWWDPGTDASFDPFADTIRIGAVDVACGTRVRLNPSHRADAHDLFYAGLLATVKGVFNDVDGQQHVAVSLDDDPAADMLEWQGRFLYFHPDEIEPLQ